MNKLIFKDNNKKELTIHIVRSVIWLAIYFGVVMFFLNSDTDFGKSYLSYNRYLLIGILVYFILAFPFIIYIILNIKIINTFVYNDRIDISSNFKKITIQLSTIQYFEYKRLNNNSQIFIFTLYFENEAKFKIKTKYVNEFVDLLQKYANLIQTNSNDNIVDDRKVLPNKWHTLNVLSIIIPCIFSVISFVFVSNTCDFNFFDNYGLLKYLLILIVSLCISNLCFCIAMYLRNNGYKFLTNYIFIIFSMMIPFVMIKVEFLNSIDVKENNDIIYEIEEKIDVDLPNNMNVRYKTFDEYTVVYAVITDDMEIEEFENRLNEYWTSDIDDVLISQLPSNINSDDTLIEVYETRFLVYNETINSYSYNSFIKWNNKITFIEYDALLSRFIILLDYNVEIKNEVTSDIT